MAEKVQAGNTHFGGGGCQPERKDAKRLVPLGVEPRTLALLAPRSNRLSYGTFSRLGRVGAVQGCMPELPWCFLFLFVGAAGKAMLEPAGTLGGFGT